MEIPLVLKSKKEYSTENVQLNPIQGSTYPAFKYIIWNL